MQVVRETDLRGGEVWGPTNCKLQASRHTLSQIICTFFSSGYSHIGRVFIDVESYMVNNPLFQTNDSVLFDILGCTIREGVMGIITPSRIFKPIKLISLGKYDQKINVLFS